MNEDNLKQKYLLPLGEKWLIFVSILFDPGILILFVIYVLLVLATYQDAIDQLIKQLIYLISSVVAGFLGSRLYKLWTDQTETKITVSRGRSAIANLALLFNNILGVKNKIQKSIDCIGKENVNDYTIKLCFEDILERCEILQEETINSIENWSDIIPAAHVKAILNGLKEKAELINTKGEEIESLKQELSETKDKKDKSETEKQQLQDKIKQKEKEVSILFKELNQLKDTLSKSPLGGLDIISQQKSLGQKLLSAMENQDHSLTSSTSLNPKGFWTLL